MLRRLAMAPPSKSSVHSVGLVLAGVAVVGPPLFHLLDWFNIAQWWSGFAMLRDLTATYDPQFILFAVFVLGIFSAGAIWWHWQEQPRTALFALGTAMVILGTCWSASRANHPFQQRHLDRATHNRMVQVLRKGCLPPNGGVSVPARDSCKPPHVYVQWDASREARDFAKDFVEVFDDAGWTAEPQEIPQHQYSDVWFGFDENGPLRAIADRFLSEMQRSYQVVHSNPQKLKAPDWYVIIGPRTPFSDDPLPSSEERQP